MTQSVQGVGPGSAEPYNKGSQHMTLGVGHLIGPHLVTGGSVVLVSGSPSTAVVTFANPLGTNDVYGAGNYTVLLTPVVTTSGSAPSGTFGVYGFSNSGFTVVGPNSSTATVFWTVSRISA